MVTLLHGSVYARHWRTKQKHFMPIFGKQTHTYMSVIEE